ncbi:MAG UNVERIFIED_CONTAM: hypothetical protein LVR29_33120 [Microcystis novacekii LVE1205-3]
MFGFSWLPSRGESRVKLGKWGVEESGKWGVGKGKVGKAGSGKWEVGSGKWEFNSNPNPNTPTPYHPIHLHHPITHS